LFSAFEEFLNDVVSFESDRWWFVLIDWEILEIPFGAEECLLSSGNNMTGKVSIPEQFVLAKSWACFSSTGVVSVHDSFPWWFLMHIHTDRACIPTHHLHASLEQGHLVGEVFGHFLLEAQGVGEPLWLILSAAHACIGLCGTF
jgi:hypothetical protein